MHGEDPNWGRILAPPWNEKSQLKLFGKDDFKICKVWIYSKMARPWRLDRRRCRSKLKTIKDLYKINLFSGPFQACGLGLWFVKKICWYQYRILMNQTNKDIVVIKLGGASLLEDSIRNHVITTIEQYRRYDYTVVSSRWRGLPY